MATMLLLPRVTKTIPGSLVGIVIATILSVGLGWQVPIIGDIPQTILLDHRLTWEGIPWEHLSDLFAPAVSIAALGAIESLLCGSVGATMSGKPFDSNQELIGQGVGNLVIPFFGGVPATAAIARSSVAIKSGAVTRVTSIIHSLVTSAPVNVQHLQAQGMPITATCPSIHVYYLTGPIFFGSVTTVLESFETAGDYHSIIISMRGVPLIDAMGIQALHQIVEEHHARGGEVLFTALQPAVLDMFKRTGLYDRVGEQNIFWSSANAIVDLHEKRMLQRCSRCHAHTESCTVLHMAQERLKREAPSTDEAAPTGAWRDVEMRYLLG